MSKLTYLDKIVAGVAVAAISIVTIVSALQSDHTLSTVSDLFYRWQTLIAGSLALIGAGWTVRHLRRQIEHQQMEYETTIRRQALSSRATLSHTLVAFSVYAGQRVDYLANFAADTPSQLPLLPETALERAANVIKYADDHTGTVLHDLVSRAQYYHSRLTSYDDRHKAIVDQLYDTVYFKCLINRLFDYARNEANTAPLEPISNHDMREAAAEFTRTYRQLSFNDVFILIDRRFPMSNEERAGFDKPSL